VNRGDLWRGRGIKEFKKIKSIISQMNNKKVVLITGCSSGIGFKTALKFARNGYITYASMRNIQSEGAMQLQQIAQQENLSLHLIAIDVTNDEQISKSVVTIFETEKRIDILVNNAGFGHLGPVELFSIDEVKEQYETNIFGVLRMIKQVIPIMRQQKSGYIINLSSINGRISFPLWSIYSSSKFAIETLTEGLRFELAHFGIKVSMVEPGSFHTQFPKNLKHPKMMKDESSPYKILTDRFFNKYHNASEKTQKNFLNKVLNPNKVVDTIYNIAQDNNPNLRYVVGIDSHLLLLFKNLLPEDAWDWILRKFYKW
jgi:short-subunit dehydrogenase